MDFRRNHTLLSWCACWNTIEIVTVHQSLIDTAGQSQSPTPFSRSPWPLAEFPKHLPNNHYLTVQ